MPADVPPFPCEGLGGLEMNRHGWGGGLGRPSRGASGKGGSEGVSGITGRAN